MNNLDDVRDDGTLQVWDKISGNLGGESSGEGDVDIVWVDLDDGLLDSEVWGLLGSDGLL